LAILANLFLYIYIYREVNDYENELNGNEYKLV